jgi:hypothetical protein
MTREEIEKLEGWELAAAVAEHGMGWPKYDGGAHESGTRPYPHFWISNHRGQMQVAVDDGNRDNIIVYWNPQADIRAAWKVVESWKYNFVISREMGLCGTMETAGTKRWRVLLCATGMEMAGIEGDELPPLICRAALLAVFATPAPAAGRGVR